METQIANPAGVGAGSLQPSNGASVLLSPGAVKTPTDEQRAKWRQKWRERKAKKTAALSGAPVPESESVPNPVAAPVATPPPVPWTADVLKPLFEQLIPAIEKADLESLKAKAAKVSPELVPLVEKDAPWNPAAKAAIATSGPMVGAKWLNLAGIGAENAAEVALVIAIGSIMTGRWILAGKLEQMAAAKEKRDRPGAAVTGPGTVTGAGSP